MTVIAATPTQAPTGICSSDEAVATGLPVSGAAGVHQPWLSRLVVPEPLAVGDILDVDARARVTNDTGRDRGEAGYTVGIGYHLWAFSVDHGGSAGQWWRISPYNGDNVTRVRHHMPLHCTTVWKVPEDWPGGRIAVVFKGDAHTTSPDREPGDKITVDHGYSVLTVRTWS